MKTIPAPLQCGVGFFGLSLISTSLPVPGRRWSPGNRGELEAGWVPALVVRCGSRSAVWSHQPRAFSLNPQPESLLALVQERVGCCVFLALDRTVLTRGAGKNTGSYSLWSSWSWREGARTCPRDPPVAGQPGQDGKQQECWPGSLSAALGATVPFLLGFAKLGSVSQPLTPFPPSSAPPGSSLGGMMLQREASSG